MHLSPELTPDENEELLNKAKIIAELKDILSIFASVPLHPLWPLGLNHDFCLYNRDYLSPIRTFLDYNCWNGYKNLGVPYHSCGDYKITYARTGGKPPLRFKNPHYISTLYFDTLEGDHSYSYPQNAGLRISIPRPKTKDDRRKYWDLKLLGPNWKTCKRRSKQLANILGTNTGLIPFNLLSQS